MPGPLPKRIEERRRRNAVPGETTVEVHGPVIVPSPLDEWHPVARAYYAALKESGQAVFYEPSDWAHAQLACSLITKALADEGTAAQAVAALAALKDLLPTESDRRKAKLQVTRILGEQADDDAPTAIDEYRKRLGG